MTLKKFDLENSLAKTPEGLRRAAEHLQGLNALVADVFHKALGT